METNDTRFALTEIEARIVKSIEHTGWYVELWFPKIDREELNFGSQVPDEEVFAAFASLVRKGALISTGDYPDWALAPGVLESAVRTLSH